MPYMCSVERIGMEKGFEIGFEKGFQKGVAEFLFLMIQDRFGSIPDWVEVKIKGAELATLRRWRERERLLKADAVEAILVKFCRNKEVTEVMAAEETFHLKRTGSVWLICTSPPRQST